MSARSMFLPEFEKVLRRYRRRCELHPGLPQSEVHEEVLFVPAFRDRRDGPGGAARSLPERFSGALFDRSGSRIEAADMARGERRATNDASPAPPEDRIGGTGVYLGWAFKHYGHALLESLSRCWIEGEFDFAVSHGARPQVPRFLQAHYDRLGVPPIISPDRVTQFERLVVPRQAFEPDTRAYGAYPDLLSRGVVRREKSTRPIYLSRSRLPADRRSVIGEEVLERALSGYEIVYPETLSVAEQVEVFSSHTTYAGALGSAMHSILFNRGPEVTYLTGTDDPGSKLNYLLCDELVEADSTYVGCCDLGGLPKTGRSTPLRLDLARAGEALGVSIDPAAQHEVDRRFREVWAEFRLRQGIREGDPAAPKEMRVHYPGPMTSRLSALEQLHAERVGGPGRVRRRARAWARTRLRSPRA